MTSFIIAASKRSSESSTSISRRSSSTTAKIRQLLNADTTRNRPGTAATSSSKVHETFDSSFATAATANSSATSLDTSSSSSSNFSGEEFHPDTRRPTIRHVSSRTTFFADSSSRSLTLDDIAEADADADAGHSSRYRTKEDHGDGSSSLPLVNEASADTERDTPCEEQRQAKRHAAFLLKPRKRELHCFAFAAEIEAELDGFDSDDDSDDEGVSDLL